MIDAQDNDWWTPLHCAASAGNWRIVNMLLSAGASVSLVNCDGDFPIDVVSDSKVCFWLDTF
jgi:ankyrin repeat protein